MPTHQSRVAASLARPSVDLRHLLGAVRVQGPRPLCVPFATSSAHEAARALSGSNVDDLLAVEALWNGCVHAGRGGHGGTTLDDTSDALTNAGQPLEVCWPYDSTLGAGTEAPPTSSHTAPWFRGALLKLPLAHDNLEERLEDALAAGIPVILVVETTREFENAAIDGEISTPAVGSPLGSTTQSSRSAPPPLLTVRRADC